MKQRSTWYACRKLHWRSHNCSYECVACVCTRACDKTKLKFNGHFNCVVFFFSVGCFFPSQFDEQITTFCRVSIFLFFLFAVSLCFVATTTTTMTTISTGDFQSYTSLEEHKQYARRSVTCDVLEYFSLSIKWHN